jgi:hypothetical protein
MCLAEMRQFNSRLMAGYEAAHRTVTDVNQALLGRLEKSEENSIRAMQSRLELAEQKEELVSQRHKRELEAAEAENAARFRNEMKTDIKGLLTLGAKKFMGVPLTGNDSHGFQDLLKSMSGDQIQSAMETGTLQLTSGQQQLLVATISELAGKPPLEVPKPEDPKPEESDKAAE